MPIWYVYETEYPEEGSTPITAPSAEEAIAHFVKLSGCDATEFSAAPEPHGPVTSLED